MPEYLFVGTTQSAVKVLDLWNGSSNNSPPTNWHQPSFDDSGWSTSVDPAGYVAGANSNSYPNDLTTPGYTDGVLEPIAPDTTPPSTQQHWLNRWTFTTPTAGWIYYQIFEYALNNLLSGVHSTYLNGTLLTNVTISADRFIGALNRPGNSNLLAWDVNHTWVNTTAAATAMLLVFYEPDEGGVPVAWGTVVEGINDRGVLGTGTASSHLVPTVMNLASGRASRISSNGKTTMIVDVFGKLYGCGDNTGGMALANAGDSNPHLTPVEVNLTNVIGGLDRVVDVAVGGDSVLALTRYGGIVGWGANAHGSVPTTSTGNPVLYVSAGARHTIHVSKNEAIVAGDNQYGQIGDGTTTDRPGGVAPDLGLVVGSVVSAVSAGTDATLAVVDGTPYGWGRAEFGALGDSHYAAGSGGNKIVSTPATLFLGSDYIAQLGPISAGLSLGDGQLGNIIVLGDGVPYGGAGDNDGTIIYGRNDGNPFAAVVGNDNGFSLLATAGGLVNGYDGGGDSLAVGAGVGPEYPGVGVAANFEVVTGGSLDTSNTTYLWPAGTNAVYEIGLPTLRAARLIVQNVAGGGTNVSVSIAMRFYSGPNVVTDAIGSTFSGSASVGATTTVFGRTPVLGPFGVQIRLQHATGTKTNVINATLELILESETIYRLFTWGYGGYGQMGSGADSTTNLQAISVNGLANVTMVCVAERTMFAVTGSGAVAARRGGSWAQVIG